MDYAEMLRAHRGTDVGASLALRTTNVVGANTLITVDEAKPQLDLYQEDWNIRTYQGQYPPARTVPGSSGTEGIFVNSMLAAGTVVSGGVNHSIQAKQTAYMHPNGIRQRAVDEKMPYYVGSIPQTKQTEMSNGQTQLCLREASERPREKTEEGRETATKS